MDLKNRFCKNIGRNHRRNGIFFVIDIENFTFTQRCTDNDCRGFQSQATPIDPALFFKRENEGNPVYLRNNNLKKVRYK